mmetsp:Transcript_54110/g.150493  ORF Transcript_54110/g.150493 Transcript_54110/m.150493 type:complete len:261 (+) Transcript_54110:989-1771(+)
MPCCPLRGSRRGRGAVRPIAPRAPATCATSRAAPCTLDGAAAIPTTDGATAHAPFPTVRRKRPCSGSSPARPSATSRRARAVTQGCRRQLRNHVTSPAFPPGAPPTLGQWPPSARAPPAPQPGTPPRTARGTPRSWSARQQPAPRRRALPRPRLRPRLCKREDLCEVFPRLPLGRPPRHRGPRSATPDRRCAARGFRKPHATPSAGPRRRIPLSRSRCRGPRNGTPSQRCAARGSRTPGAARLSEFPLRTLPPGARCRAK